MDNPHDQPDDDAVEQDQDSSAEAEASTDVLNEEELGQAVGGSGPLIDPSG